MFSRALNRRTVRYVTQHRERYCSTLPIILTCIGTDEETALMIVTASFISSTCFDTPSLKLLLTIVLRHLAVFDYHHYLLLHSASLAA